MQKREQELAKRVYKWLKSSPLFTVVTFFIIYYMGLSEIFCGSYACNYDTTQFIDAVFGVLGSALWHLTLLQYVNNKESDLVHWHGAQALLIAGVRTLIPLLSLVIGFFLGSIDLSCSLSFIGLFIIWAIVPQWGNRQVERGECILAQHMGKTVNQSVSSDNTQTQTEDLSPQFKKIHKNMLSDDGVTRILALMELDAAANINDEILHELEAMAANDENDDIRKDARLLLERFADQKPTALSHQIVNAKYNTLENSSQQPESILDQIRSDLQSANIENRLNAITQLHTINYSSESIRNLLEKLALHDPNKDMRAEALTALDLAAQRNVRSRLNKIEIGKRHAILQEISDWEKLGLLEKENAEVLRRRYNFDLAPAATPKPAFKTEAVELLNPIQSEPTQKPAVEKISAPESDARVQEKSQPTLTQTLLSETSIKIALYLGAFFVIASAAILGAFVDIFRIPLLIIATIIFGGLSVVIRKRLPQPAFALFIIFSCLLPITANVIEESLNLSLPFNGAYWVFVSACMAFIWAGGTQIYESRLFSITAFASITVAFYRFGDMFNAASEFYPSMLGLAALTGLAGAWALKQWKNANFALPLFLAAQALQVITLTLSTIYFFSQLNPLWNLASIFTWGFAFLFFIFSDLLFPFLFFPWLAAGTLFAIPWLVGAAFELETLGGTILFFIWGFILAASSEVLGKFEKTYKYNLPVLLISIFTASIAIAYGFLHNETAGFICALSTALLYTALHLTHPRGWLWAVALLNFIIAYFVFFNLPFIQNINIFFGYKLLGLSMILLLPDLFLKNDFKDNWTWRLPTRIYGALFTTLSFLIYPLLNEAPLINTAILFGVYAFFFAVYALRYDTALIAYIATTSLAISTIYIFNYFEINIVLESLSILSMVYFLSGFALKKYESRAAWRTMLEASGLILGGLVSLTALFTQKEYMGWFVVMIGILFIIEMYSRKQNLFEVGAQIILAIACYLILSDLHIVEFSYIVTAISLVILNLDMLFMLTFKGARPLELPVKMIAGVFVFSASMVFLTENNNLRAAIGFAIYTVFFSVYTTAQRKAVYGYIPAAYLPLTIFFMLKHVNIDAWLPALTSLAVLYFGVGAVVVRSQEAWSRMLRYSGLALGSVVSLGALFTLKETGGWYALVIGLLFAAEMAISANGLFEIGFPIFFNMGAYLILHDTQINELAYHLLAYSLVWLLTDLLAHLTFFNPRPLMWVVRTIGASIAALNYVILFFDADAPVAAVGFGVYALLFLTTNLVYRKPNFFYAFTLTLPLFVTFLFRTFDVTKWIHPVIVIAIMYYALGFLLRVMKRAKGWDEALLLSGLGIGVLVSFAAPLLGGIDAALPVALAGTLWAAEAFARRNIWLGFPANGLYLLSYFIILFELNVEQPQFFSMGAALLGMLQHYLLTRTGNKTGVFVMGMVSQLTLLGTTYIQMVSNGSEGLIYFIVLFLQSIAVLVYGVVVRSRSLTFTPIFFAVVGVMSVLYIVVYNLLDVITTIMMVGCTGVVLLMLGIFAVMMRERIIKIGERLSDWEA